MRIILAGSHLVAPDQLFETNKSRPPLTSLLSKKARLWFLRFPPGLIHGIIGAELRSRSLKCALLVCAGF